MASGPNLEEKKLLLRYGLRPNEWLVIKRPPNGELHLRHRVTRRKMVLSKDGGGNAAS
ncbi:hypothetical protein V6C27_02785 [Peptococcaceae bacterium 1198_IL3148]